MAAATPSRSTADVLQEIQHVIEAGHRCCQSEDVDCSHILLDLRQAQRSLQLIQLDENNKRDIEVAVSKLIENIDTLMSAQTSQSRERAFSAPRQNLNGKNPRFLWSIILKFCCCRNYIKI